MTDDASFTDREILRAIGRELKEANRHLSTIRTVIVAVVVVQLALAVLVLTGTVELATTTSGRF